MAELQNRVLELNAEKKEYTTTTLLNNDSNKFELKTVATFYKELIEEFMSDNKCGINGTYVDIRHVFQGALLTNAVSIILAHNHPSGNTRPSREDDKITDRIVKAGELLNIQVVDHIIYTKEHFYSYADEGRI